MHVSQPKGEKMHEPRQNCTLVLQEAQEIVFSILQCTTKRKIVVQSKELTKLENAAVKLTITIGKNDVRSEYNNLISKYSKSIQIPGFRKGKVPAEIMERKFAES